MMMLRIILNIASDDTGSQRGPSLSAIKPPQRGEESLEFLVIRGRRNPLCDSEPDRCRSSDRGRSLASWDVFAGRAHVACRGAARGGARVATAVHRCAPREGGSVFGIE
jgi:hypothetical protein